MYELYQTDNWDRFSVKMGPTFAEKGFRNWKKLPEAFTNHKHLSTTATMSNY